MDLEEELYYPCSENKGADQLRSRSASDQRLCFSPMQIFWFSDALAQMIYFFSFRRCFLYRRSGVFVFQLILLVEFVHLPNFSHVVIY